MADPDVNPLCMQWGIIERGSNYFSDFYFIDCV